MAGEVVFKSRLLLLFSVYLLTEICRGNHTASSLPPTTKAPVIRTQPTDQSLLRECSQSDTSYIYTKCTEEKQRWRVAVPNEFNTCRLSNPPPPVKGQDCGFSCQAGYFLDIIGQECRPCKAGTYSVGGTLKFDKWDRLPKGFTTWGIDPEDESPDDSEGSSCKGKQWTAEGDVVASAGDECKSVLVYSVDLERPGNLTFSYRSQTDSSYFHVYAVNGVCSKNSKQEIMAGVSIEWTAAAMALKAGRNVIFWEAAYFDTERVSQASLFGGSKQSGINYDSTEERKIQVKDIVITGLPYDTECKPCEPGTYSRPGSSTCKKCEKNTYSLAGRSVCTACDNNEFSDSGASVCKSRPLCSERDYFETWTSCDDKMKTHHIYDWVSPKICDSQKAGSVALPKSSGPVVCPPCNPGQFLNGSHCSFCPDGWYGNGASACRKCYVGTTPKTGIYVKYWTGIDTNVMKFGCFANSDRGCTSKSGWSLSQNFADSGIGHSDNAELFMWVIVPNFKNVRSLFVMEFALHCESDCRLTLSEYHYGRGRHTVRSWKGEIQKTKFIHHVQSTGKIKFRLSFEKPYSPDETTYKYAQDRAFLYSLNITNAENGGANECDKCSMGTLDSKCITCGTGKYLDDDGKCQACPAGKFLNVTEGRGRDGCQPCPFGTKVNPSGTGCFSDCHVYFGKRHFDFSNLKGSMLMRGANLFTGKGFPYYHVFNITICGLEQVRCHNNVSLPRDDGSDRNDQTTRIVSNVCRSTVIPSKREGNLLTQSVSLADDIGSLHYGGNSIEILLKDAPTTPQTNNTKRVSNSSHEDVHFIYKYSTITPHCTEGFRTIVTMRCDPSAKGRGVVKPPENCPHGTCDGCIFSFIWHTEHACPKCTYLDYRNITAACKDGKVLVHHVWKDNPRMCRGGDDLPIDEERACTLFETPILDFKIVLFIFLCLAVLLVMLVLFLCYRNSRLQYKYHRLVDGGGMKDGELPAVEKCALDDDEDEEDEIILARNPRGTNHILDRLKKLKNGKSNFDEFESMQMRSQSEDEFSH